MKGWIGVDLDGTLAHYDGWKGELHIGDPIELMVLRVKRFLREGTEVRIFTARVTAGPKNEDGSDHDISKVVGAIEEWCEKHIGAKLPVTNIKDYGMIELYDDRAIGIVSNTGLIK